MGGSSSRLGSPGSFIALRPASEVASSHTDQKCRERQAPTQAAITEGIECRVGDRTVDDIRREVRIRLATKPAPE
jgi:hypothetical protein